MEEREKRRIEVMEAEVENGVRCRQINQVNQ